MQRVRDEIEAGTFGSFRAQFVSGYRSHREDE